MSVVVAPALRSLVMDRDGLCVVQQASCFRALSARTLQHRVNRGMGGSPLALLDFPENLIVMCSECNWRLEADAAFAAVGRRMGWKLSDGEDPARVAYFHNGEHRWVLPDAVGWYRFVDRREPAIGGGW